MRILTSFLLGICILFGIGNMVHAGSIKDVFKDNSKDPLYCARKGECDLDR